MNPVNTITNRQAIRTLVQPSDVKLYVPLGTNIVDVTLTPHIITATDTVINPIVGKRLFDRFMAELIAANYITADLPDSTQSVDAVDYKELYQQMYLPLIWHSALHSLPFIAVKMTEKGIMLNNSDYSDNGGIVALNEMKFTIRKTAELYTEQLQCYIKDTFKEDKDVMSEHKDEGGFFSGIHFQRRVKSCDSCMSNHCNCTPFHR